MIFRANGVKMVKEGIYRVVDEDKYHGQVRGQTLSRASALRVKCETDRHCNHLNAVQDVLVERKAVCAAAARHGGREGESGHASPGFFSPACHRGQ